MPNHVTNKISLDVAKLFTNSEGDIDFNIVLPMPESLVTPDPQQMESRAKAAMGLFQRPSLAHGFLGALSDQLDMQKFIDGMFKPIADKDINLLIQAIQNIRDYGFAYWYPWACVNWGTKWNAYQTEINDSFCTFQTAWSHPKAVFLKLSEIHPDIEIAVEYADEDLGSNCGTVRYRAGVLVSQNIAPSWSALDSEGKNHWRRFALSLTDPENINERMAEIAEEEGTQ